jgi:hypothetical protein
VVGLEREGLLPKDTTLAGADTQDPQLVGVVVSGREENLVTPQHWRRMSGAGQRDLPIEILLRPLGRDGLGGTKPRTIGAAEPGPFLARPLGHGGQEQNQDEAMAE